MSEDGKTLQPPADLLTTMDALIAQLRISLRLPARRQIAVDGIPMTEREDHFSIMYHCRTILNNLSAVDRLYASPRNDPSEVRKLIDRIDGVIGPLPPPEPTIVHTAGGNETLREPGSNEGPVDD